jgi:hypothetical protein
MAATRLHALLFAWLAAACGPGEAPSPPLPAPAEAPERAGSGPARPGPPTAHWEIVDLLRESAEATFHPADGGGRAWLVAAEPKHPAAATRGRFELAYEAGPLGVATGGGIYFQVSPFWGWSTPQVEDPDAPGYTTVSTEARDAALEARTLDEQLLGIFVRGRPLAAGERVTIAYGAGPAGATSDRYAERGSRFFFGVDGDGDGLRKLLPDEIGVDVGPGPAARLAVHVPGVARPGEAVAVTLAVLDERGSAGVAFEGELALTSSSPALAVPERVRIAPGDAGFARVDAKAAEAGVAYVEAKGPDGLVARSNPILVTRDGPRILWGDLHGHSALSDGTGTPEEYFRYARDVAALDVVALTDHDHWGMRPLDADAEAWREIQAQTRRFHEPGRFVTIPGYEWTSWIYGHRHVLWFDGDGEILSSLSREYESPQQLWKGLEGREALTFAHHSAGGPIATDWSIPPDPHFEPVTEIASVHGSSESPDSPNPIYSSVAGNWVRDALGRGYRLGFVGSGDSHDGHPGLAQLASPTGGGLAAILSEERTREGVLAALRARRVYATNGPRILLRAALGTHPMGSSVPLAAGETRQERLFVHAVGTGPLAHVDLVRSGEVVDSLDADGREELMLEKTLEGLRAGEWVYVRVVQRDGGAAWSSPVFFE